MSSNFKKGPKLFPFSGKIRGDLEAMKSEVGNIGEKLDSFSEGMSGSINLYLYLQYSWKRGQIYSARHLFILHPQFTYIV